jgi:hypothetical protein
VGLASALLAVAVAGGCSSFSDDDVLSGVVTVSEPRPEPSTAAGGNADEEGITTFGMVMVENPDGQEMELLGVRVNATPGVEIVDVFGVPAPGDEMASSWAGGGPGFQRDELFGDAEAASLGSVVAADSFETSAKTPFLRVLLVLRCTR